MNKRVHVFLYDKTARKQMTEVFASSSNSYSQFNL